MVTALVQTRTVRIQTLEARLRFRLHHTPLYWLLPLFYPTKLRCSDTMFPMQYRMITASSGTSNALQSS